MFTKTGEEVCFSQTDQGRLFLAISKRTKGFLQPAHQSQSALLHFEKAIGEGPQTAFYKKRT